MKNKLLLIIKIFVSAGLLFLIILKVDWSQLHISLLRGNLIYLSLGVILGIGFNLIKFSKWHNIIKLGKNDYSYWDGAKSYMIGNALGMVTPMRVGDIGRALYFIPSERPKMIGFTFIDRLIDLITVCILSIGGGYLLINHGFCFLLIVLSVMGLFLLFSPIFFYKIVKNIIPNGKINKKIGRLIEIFKFLDIKTILICLILSVAAFIITILEFTCVISAFENTTFLSIFLVTPLITLSALIPVTIMGLGVREGLSILLFSKFGVSEATALTAAFLCFLINNVTISIIGIFYLSRLELTFRNKNNVCTEVQQKSIEVNITE